jgi:hypothetical protein
MSFGLGTPNKMTYIWSLSSQYEHKKKTIIPCGNRRHALDHMIKRNPYRI